MTVAKVQHYVPQFLLRNFGNGKKDQVWVYDKSTGRKFPSNAKNVASESRFYDFEFEGESMSIEPWLSGLEGKARSVIELILTRDSLNNLGEEHRSTLASFVAVQLTRTKTFREQWNSFPSLLREHFVRTGTHVAPGSQAEELLCDISENESKEQTARIVVDAPQTYAPQFLNKTWILLATDRKHPFLLSDNPLVRQNTMEQPHRSNLGLACEGIEVYFPLSPTRALAFWCSTLTEIVHRGALSAMASSGSDPGGPILDPQGVVALSALLLSGNPVPYSATNVENFNSLQVGSSERYVFSSANDFHHTDQLLAKHPKLKRGPRLGVA